MTRSLLSLIIVLVGCSGSVPEGEPTAPESSPAAKPAPEAEAGPAPELFEAEDGLYGYRSASGEVVIPAKFPMAMPFEDRVAGVVVDGGWAFIDGKGTVLAKAFVFDNGADAFVEGRARIVEGEGHGFIASSGEIVVPPTWSFAQPFSGGYAAVCEGCKRESMGEHYAMTGGKWGYVDAAGKVVIPPRFGEAEPFVDGRASVREGERTLVIGPDGAELVP